MKTHFWLIVLFAASLRASPVSAEMEKGEILLLSVPQAAGHLASLPEYRQQKVRAERDLEIVFIPGILGSHITVKGKTFGLHRPDSTWLAYEPGQSVTTSTLNEFQVPFAGLTLKRLDIYGTGLDLLRDTFFGKAPIEFSYDWRADLDESVLLLDQLMSSPRLAGKRAIIVAHSMGGLIAWKWLKSTEQRRSVEVLGAVFLGSPLRGSCEPIRMLISGYSAAPGSGIWEELATKAVFQNAHAAMFTFPSIFALMPKEGEVCVKRVLDDESDLEVNHFSSDFWIGRSGSIRGVGAKFGAAAGMSRPDYERRVGDAISKGKEFRNSLNLDPTNVPVYLLFSVSRKMHESLVIGTTDNWFAITSPAPRSNNGDGRVLARSATNYDALARNLNSSAHEVDYEHGALLADPKFSRFVRYNLLPRISERVYIALVARAANRGTKFVPAGKTALVRFEPSWPQEEPGSSDDRAKASLGTFNFRQFGVTSALEAATFLKEGDVRSNAVKAALYDSLLSHSPKSLEKGQVLEASKIKLAAGEYDHAAKYALFGLESFAGGEDSETMALRDAFAVAKQRSFNSLLRGTNITGGVVKPGEWLDFQRPDDRDRPREEIRMPELKYETPSPVLRGVEHPVPK